MTDIFEAVKHIRFVDIYKFNDRQNLTKLFEAIEKALDKPLPLTVNQDSDFKGYKMNHITSGKRLSLAGLDADARYWGYINFRHLCETHGVDHSPFSGEISLTPRYLAPTTIKNKTPVDKFLAMDRKNNVFIQIESGDAAAPYGHTAPDFIDLYYRGDKNEKIKFGTVIPTKPEELEFTFKALRHYFDNVEDANKKSDYERHLKRFKGKMKGWELNNEVPTTFVEEQTFLKNLEKSFQAIKPKLR